MISKEDIHHVKFVSFEVLNSSEEKLARRAQIENAMLLGNGSKGKSKIYFMGADGMLEVETTVWAASDDVITLKGGVIIPVHCIQKIELI